MAGPRKYKRVKDTGSPNIVLVIFLIMFFLSNIVLGLLLYFAYQEKNDATRKEDIAKKEKTGAEKALLVYQTMTDELRSAMGQKLAADEKEKLDVNRKSLLDESGSLAAAAEKNRGTFKELIEGIRKDLDFDSGTGEYKLTYMKKAEDAEARATKSEASWKEAQKSLVALQTQWKTLTEKQDAFFQKTDKRFDNEQQAVLKEVSAQTAEMAAQIQKNQELNNQIAAEAKKTQTQLKEKGKEIAELKEKLAKALEMQADGSGGARAASDNVVPHALLLDISGNKPLWDDPVGKVTRIDPKGKEVTINVGSAKGVRPDLTFSVFAPSQYSASRAADRMKGTIEVTRVLGPHSSLARITATFDRSFTIQEGDLLFNMFWGTRVAIAGYVDVAGTSSESPTEQMRQLSDFMYLLERQGIIIDAYVDLTDGQIRGNPSPNTRYLIRGSDLRIDPKDLQDMEPRAQRAKAVNDKAGELQKDAIAKGLFVISDKNFANVIGYRAPGATAKDQPRLFLPTAGGSAPAIGAPGPAGQPPMPPAEKKDEKKDDKGGI